ncbi:MAG TPA: response regulator transcription factor [Verrucomicrobiae bacterium]|jgi:DNA-binding NarL/FixJ family response regulator|nr:response regulator transcription factor [Verrucomicrobiae bacterium]
MSATVPSKKVGKVLIVDDSARVRQAIRALLQGVVEEMIEAGDGASAVAAYLAHKPDWVTMDLEMGPVGGLAAVQQIIARDPQARILIVTVQDAKSFLDAARQAGACGYVLKEDLRSIIGFIAPNFQPRPHARPKAYGDF